MNNTVEAAGTGSSNSGNTYGLSRPFPRPMLLLAAAACFLVCAVVTAVYMHFYSLNLATIISFCVLGPTAFVCLVALPDSGHRSVLAARIYVALGTSFVAISIVVSIAASRVGNRYFVTGALEVISLVLLAILSFEIVMVLAALYRVRRRQTLSGKLPWVGTVLAAALTAGWIAGMLFWAMHMPFRAIAAAETIARERPYCITVNGYPAEGARDLTGVTMLAWNDGEVALHFHAVLVVGDGPGREYFNWSYRRGGFFPIDAHFQKRLLGFGDDANCSPTKHFARDWL